MLLRRLVAFPESHRILKLHLLAMPFLALQYAVIAMVPVLLRKNHADEWQTALSVSAISIMLMLAIFWNEVYRRWSARRYLLVYWLLAVCPLAGVALCHRPGTMLFWVLLSAAGMGGFNSISGDLMRSCYPPDTRSKVFGAVQACQQLTIMVAALGIGHWLDINPESYRLYFPAAVVLIGVGLWLIYRITRQPLFQERLQSRSTEPLLACLGQAYRNMMIVLRDDPHFRRYETAFGLYGLGWMICAALLPFLCVDVLGLGYADIAWSTQSVLQIVLLAMTVPTGYLMDRLGPVRVSGWAFAWLATYPLGLIAASSVWGVAAATFLYALGITAVTLSWTIGPITMARSAAQAPHYLAIHASLVSVRAILVQFPAVALYAYTGSLNLPLAMAVVMFVGGAILMIRLDRHLSRHGDDRERRIRLEEVLPGTDALP